LDRCALFVDAGYALGDGALAVHGTRNRDSVSWDYAGLVKLLSSLSRDRTGLPLLRCYWYDMAGAGSRVTEHDTLADLPGVKVRLSKARPSRKEGVEAEIRKDLTALARNRSVSDVIIVSAEEDLAPVIAEVQEFGVRALLLHIGTDGSWANSRALRQECDEVIEISPSHLRPYVDLISGAEPQLAAAGYRELPAGAAQVSGPHAVVDTAGARLYDSPVPSGYEHAAQLSPIGGQAQDPRSQAPQPQPANFYHQSDVGGPGFAAAADAGFGQAAFAGTDGAHSANGRAGAAQVHDFTQRGMTADGRAHGGPAASGGADQPVMGLAPAIGSAGPGAHAMPGTGVPANQAGVPGNGVPAGSGHENGFPAAAVPGNGVPGNGMSAHGLSGTGLPTHGVPGGMLPSAESAAPMMQPGVTSQGGRVGGQLDAGPGGPQHQVPAQAIPPAGPGQPGQPPSGQMLTGQMLTGQPLTGQQPPALPQPQQVAPPPPQPASAVPQSPALSAGQHSARGLAGQQNGLVPFDAQRPPLPQRQLPAGNGMPYGEDRGAPYQGQPSASAQFGGQAGQQPYGSGLYPAPPSAPPPAQLPVGEAVQSAHAEGFGFGEAVARDAPALWLEAVLARKPRMPSDLEARLLQGSALPIDSLLHDEVRHALRRGFWDALERSRH
jgi:uncharacterized LabA/DUF88 family protein